MNLSNRLTFSLVFSVLLIAAFAFVVAPAMAQVTVTAYETVTADDTDTDDVNESKVVLTLTYSENPNPKPNISHFTLPDNTNTPIDDDGDRDAYSGAGATIGGEGKTVTVTFVPVAPATVADIPSDLQLRGYQTDLSNVETSDDGTNNTPLVLLADHIAGYTYIVYANDTGTAGPVLPNTVDAVDLLVDMPDLEEFFNVGGGTIDLKVADTAENSKHVIINEIMWAVDTSKTGQPGETTQQWIEVYNRLTTPAPTPTLAFEDDTFPAPAIAAGTSDRLSNIAGHQNVWSPPIKGQSGSATRGTNGTGIIGADPAFISMYRSKQGDNGVSAGSWTASERPYFPGFLGTPGGANTRPGLPGTRGNPGATEVKKDKVIINEVYNHATENDGDANDWLELRNVSTADVNLENWRLSHTTGKDRVETLLVKFPKRTIPAGKILLIVNKDPYETDLIVGQDIAEAEAANQANGAAPHLYLNIKRSNSKDLHIPNLGDGGYLILRTPPRKDKGDTDGFGGRVGIHDLIGPSRVPDISQKHSEVSIYQWSFNTRL